MQEDTWSEGERREGAKQPDEKVSIKMVGKTNHVINILFVVEKKSWSWEDKKKKGLRIVEGRLIREKEKEEKNCIYFH